MEIILTTAILGLAASIFAEVVKLIPRIYNSEVLTSITAIICVAIVAFIANGMIFSFDSFAMVMVAAFLNYKLIVSPISKSMVRQLP